MRAARWTAVTLMTVALCGCGGSFPPFADRSATTPSPPPAPSAESPSPSPTSPSGLPAGAGGRFVQEGVVGYYGVDPFTIEVKAVERHRDLTALKLELTTTKDYAGGEFGHDGLPLQSTSFSRFRLLDPVGGKVYFALRENTADGKAFGTRHERNNYPASFRAGVRYPVEVYFPPLPAEVEQVSIVPDLPIAPFTGVPVTEATAPLTAKQGDETTDPEPGSQYQWPVVLPEGEIWSSVVDVNELIETPQKETTKAGDQETVALRADVLFRFDKADLSDKAIAVLDEVVAETRERADPAKPPILIEGHTDSKGDDSYNHKLSLNRAEAVHRYLAGRLGDAYVYKVTGKGESEPVADNEKPDGSDNPEGRARNRRVEISYRIKEQLPDVTTTQGPSADEVRGSVHPPASFRSDAGPVVGSLNWARHNDRLRVDFHPFYRDGAYLVAVFDVVVESSQTFVPLPSPFGSGTHPFSSRSGYSSFILVDPATKARYHPLKMNTEFVENFVPVLKGGEVSRSYVYYPAPADTVKSITLEAEGLGTVKDIPVHDPR